MENIVIILFSPHILAWVAHILPAIEKSSCKIAETRMLNWGAYVGSMTRAFGTWDALAKLENSLTALAAQEGLFLMFRRMANQQPHKQYTPYTMQIIGLHNTRVLSDVLGLFGTHGIAVLDLQVDSMVNHYSHSDLMSCFGRLQIPEDAHIATVRDQFLTLCEDANVDGWLETDKSIK